MHQHQEKIFGHLPEDITSRSRFSWSTDNTLLVRRFAADATPGACWASLDVSPLVAELGLAHLCEVVNRRGDPLGPLVEAKVRSKLDREARVLAGRAAAAEAEAKAEAEAEVEAARHQQQQQPTTPPKQPAATAGHVSASHVSASHISASQASSIPSPPASEPPTPPTASGGASSAFALRAEKEAVARQRIGIETEIRHLQAALADLTIKEAAIDRLLLLHRRQPSPSGRSSMTLGREEVPDSYDDDGGSGGDSPLPEMPPSPTPRSRHGRSRVVAHRPRSLPGSGAEPKLAGGGKGKSRTGACPSVRHRNTALSGSSSRAVGASAATPSHTVSGSTAASASASRAPAGETVRPNASTSTGDTGNNEEDDEFDVKEFDDKEFDDDEFDDVLRTFVSVETPQS